MCTVFTAVILDEIRDVAAKLPENSGLMKEIDSIAKNLNNYISHIVCGKYQREKSSQDIEQLKPGQAVVVADYMMKLLFQKASHNKGINFILCQGKYIIENK